MRYTDFAATLEVDDVGDGVFRGYRNGYLVCTSESDTDCWDQLYHINSDTNWWAASLLECAWEEG